VKATYDGVVRLPISLAMISTLRARLSSVIHPVVARRRASSSIFFPRVLSARSAFASSIARAPRRFTRRGRVPKPSRLDERKYPRCDSTVLTPPSRSPIVPRTRLPHHARITHRVRESAAAENASSPIAHIARDTHRSCCQTPTQEYVVPRSIPIAGPSALLMFRVVERARVVKCRSTRSSTRETFRRSSWKLSEDMDGLCEES